MLIILTVTSTRIQITHIIRRLVYGSSHETDNGDCDTTVYLLLYDDRQ